MDSTKRITLINITYIVSFVFLTIFLGLSSFSNHSISYDNYCYSFLKELSSSDFDWAIGNYIFPDGGMNVVELRNEIKNADKTYGFFRKTFTSHIVALDNDNHFFNFDCKFDDIQLEPTRLITLSDFCDGNTLSDGKLYTIPLQMMFADNYCDIKEYKDPLAIGSSYIPIDMANAIISSSDSLNNYSDLLGKKYYINGFPFTINNVFYSNTYLAPFLLKYYGKFIVTDSSQFLDNYNLSLSSAYQADSISQNDYISYFKNKNVDLINFTYLKNDKWQSNDYTSFVEEEIFSKRNINPYSNFIFWVSGFLLILEAILLIYLINKRFIYKKVFWILFVLSFAILLLITIGNLFFYNQPAFLNFFNNYLTIHAVINITLLTILPVFKSNFKKSAMGGRYEIDI